MRTLLGLIVFVMVGLCSFSSVVHGAQNIHIGTLEIHPFASVSASFNDNIYTEAKDLENGDQITIYETGLSLLHPIKPGKSILFKADYAARFLQYNRYDKEDRTDHSVNALLDSVIAQHLMVRIKESFNKTADPPNSELTDLEKRLRNNIEGALGLKSEKIGVECAYAYIRDNYDNLNYLDKKETIVTPKLFINISPKTAIFAEYNAGKIEYDETAGASPDSDYSQVRGGIQGTIAPKLTGVLKAGYKETDYEDTRTTNKKNFKGNTFFGNVTYKIKERSTLNFYGERLSADSTYAANNYYRDTNGGARLEHLLTKRLIVLGGGSYGVNKYPEEATAGSVTDIRRDIVQGAHAGLRYEFKEWIMLEGTCTYKKRESNFDTYDYHNTITAATLSMKF